MRLNRLYQAVRATLYAPENDGTGAGGTGAGGTGAGGTGAGGTGPWYASFENPSVKEWLASFPENAYPNPEAVALKAMNLEKFVGAEKAGRGVILPKPDAKPEEWRDFYKKAGLYPEKPDGYKLPDNLDKDPMMIKLRDAAHAKGIPAPAFEAITSVLAAEAEAAEKARIAEWEQKSEQEIQQLYGEWGAEKDKNLEFGQRAARAFIPHKDKAELQTIITKMEGALGSGFTMRFFANIGKAMQEHGFVAGDGVVGDGGMTPEAARNRIAQLKQDSGFRQKLMDKDAEATAEWNKLHKIGFGGLQQP